MIEIDFNDLLENYSERLLNDLRGFGKNNDYLKFYVPGTSPLKSFFNLCDALYEAKHLSFLIFFNENTFEENTKNKIYEFLEIVSSYSEKNDKNAVIINIDIKQIKYNEYLKNNKIKITKNNEIQLDKKIDIDVYKSQKNIEELYLKNLDRIKIKNFYSLDKNLKDIYSYNANDIKFYFKIENKIIVECWHNYQKNDYKKKLIEAFFEICFNKNIQEAAEHGVIYLEEKIRLISSDLIKPGIILPSHAGLYFDELNKAIRSIYDDFKNKNKIYETNINKNYFRKSYHWVNLGEDDKINMINRILSEILIQNELLQDSLNVVTIENNHRVYLSVNKEFRQKQAKKNILLEIEIKLKKLDETLEVFIDESLDKNKLRLKNSPQTKLS